VQINDFKSEMWSIMYQVKANMQKFIEPILQAEDLTMIQSYILFGISKGTVTNISSLCKELGINQGNVSTMCKQMEKAGLINRNRSNEDERIVTLSLTELGKNKIERLDSTPDELNTIFEQIPTEKLNTIINGMREFSELIKILSLKK
jgi:MarR family transcriptional regulator, organic hydroperoxide resistance regulator